MRAGEANLRIDRLVHKCVFHLHKTFANNVRVCYSPGPYCVKEHGYGQFDMTIDIYFAEGDSTESPPIKYSLVYFLELPPANATAPLNLVRKEKISFVNPSPVLRRLLIESGAVVKSATNTISDTISNDKKTSMTNLAHGLANNRLSLGSSDVVIKALNNSLNSDSTATLKKKPAVSSGNKNGLNLSLNLNRKVNKNKNKKKEARKLHLIYSSGIWSKMSPPTEQKCSSQN